MLADTPISQSPNLSSIYAKRVDAARKAVAIAFLVFGIGLVISAHGDDGRKTLYRWDLGWWPWAVWFFAIGCHACLAATAALIVEALTRSWKRRGLTAFELSLVILIGILAYLATIAVLIGVTPQAK
jgi:hypothetical protein